MDERLQCETGIHQNLEENIGSNLYNICQSNLFYDNLFHDISKGKRNKHKMNLWDFIRIKSFCTAKETLKKTKRQPTEWENIFAKDSTDKTGVQDLQRTSQTQHTRNK